MRRDRTTAAGRSRRRVGTHAHRHKKYITRCSFGVSGFRTSARGRRAVAAAAAARRYIVRVGEAAPAEAAATAAARSLQKAAEAVALCESVLVYMCKWYIYTLNSRRDRFRYCCTHRFVCFCGGGVVRRLAACGTRSDFQFTKKKNNDNKKHRHSRTRTALHTYNNVYIRHAHIWYTYINARVR